MVFMKIEIFFMLQSLLPINKKKENSIDDNRLRSNFATNGTKMFTKKSLFYVILGYNQSLIGELRAFEGVFQILPGSYKSDKPINIIGEYKFLYWIKETYWIIELLNYWNYPKEDCIDGSILKCLSSIRVPYPILWSFSLDLSPGHKIYKEPIVKFFEKINNSVLSHITFFLEDNNKKTCRF